MNGIGQVQNDGITLLDLLKAVKKHAITAVITLVAILVAVAAFTFLSTPKYTATSELLATYRSSSGAAGSGTSSIAGELSSGASYINSQIQTYDYVFVDTAPMQVSNDAAIFAKDGPSLLLVAGLGATEKKLFRQTVSELDTLDIHPVGVATNYTEPEKSHSNTYYYYGEDNGKGNYKHKRQGKTADETQK